MRRFLGLVSLFVLTPHITLQASSFEACRASADGVGIEATVYCLLDQARKSGDWAGAEVLLTTMLREHPDEPWIHLGLGHVIATRRGSESAAHFRTASEEFASRGEYAREAETRLSLADFLESSGQLEAADSQREAAESAAARAPDSDLTRRLQYSRARAMLGRGREVRKAYRLLRQLDARRDEAPYNFQSTFLILLGNASRRLGHWEEAIGYYRQCAELARGYGDLQTQASVRFNLLLTLLDEPGRASKEQSRQLAGEALEAAVLAGDRLLEVRARRVMGRLTPGPAGLSHLKEALKVAREIGERRQTSVSLQALAARLVEENPSEAAALMREGLGVALEDGDLAPLLYGWTDRMEVAWKTLPAEDAYRDSLLALEMIELLRQLQSGWTGRSELFSFWAPAYGWLAGRALKEASESPDDAWKERAFDLSERMRARVLLERTALESADEKLPESAASAELGAVLDRIAAANRRLSSSPVTAEERKSLLTTLDALRLEEERLRESEVRGGVLARPFAHLNHLQGALSPQEAVIAYLTTPGQDAYGRFAGGSWVLTITRKSIHARPLPDPGWLGPAANAYLGLVFRRDREEPARAAGALIYDKFLAPALEQLAPEVNRLILIPDGELHQVPFAGLRATPDGPSLAQRFRVYQAPSATLWLKWKQQTSPKPGPALVLADPAFLGKNEDEPSSPARAWSQDAAGLGGLPFARREGRAVVDQVGGSSQLLLGGDATEAFLKDADLKAYSVLHVAAHALIDEQSAGRSAILLAPGSDREDGVLEASEASRLGLRSPLVVLAACRSASGRRLRGEGVLGLGRSFFEAGAQAVIGSLWPLRDDEGAAFFKDFYRELARGLPAADALSAVQAQWSRRGEPDAAWAGITLIGNGDLAPVRAPRRWGSTIWLLSISALLIGLWMGGRILLRTEDGGENSAED